MMQVDTIKAIATYIIAGLLLTMGFLILRDPAAASDVKILMGGFMGSALTYVFGDAANTRGQRSFEKGLNTPTPPAP